jgi:hypothetical protein
MTETTHHFYNAEIHDCTPGRCAEVAREIQNICKANKWPPGHKVLVCSPDTGECCNCHC